MIASELLRLRFQALLARGLAASEVARQAGLAGVSEVWGGDEPRDGAAWYLWLRDRPGAYRLDLEEGRALDGVAGAPALGRLAIRYYPSPRDAELASFSPEERAIAGGGWLDDTGAPRIERAGSIPDGFFGVGSLDCGVDPEAGTLLLALGSLDRLRVRYEDAWCGESYPLGAVRRARGERTRDVPGWALAAPVFAALAGVVSRLERPAARLVMARQPGFEIVHGQGGVECRDASERVQGDAVLLFGPACPCPSHEDALLREVLGPEAEIVLDRRSGELRRQPEVPEPRLPLPIDPAWFDPEPAREDRVGCRC